MVGYCGTYIRNKHSRFDGVIYCLGIHADTWNTKRVLPDLSLIHLPPMAPPLIEDWAVREAGDTRRRGETRTLLRNQPAGLLIVVEVMKFPLAIISTLGSG